MRNNVKFLQSEDGRRNAERFIKAMRENRVVCCVKHVSSSGMSREIYFGEFVWSAERGQAWMMQFNWFFNQLGWSWGRKYIDAITVKGCGMDMRFHVLNSVIMELKDAGYDVTGLNGDEYLSI